jgi:hypothetical protein
MLDAALSLLCVVAIALFFVSELKVNTAFSPFLSLLFIILFCCLSSMLGLIYFALVAVYVFAACCVVFLLLFRRDRLKGLLREFFSPAVVFFIVSSSVLFITLAVRKPYFMAWDVFSFWGAAAKCIFQNHQIYTMTASGMINVSYPPALPALSVFVQVFSKTFAEYKVFWALDMFMMSVMSMLFAKIRWRNVAGTVMFFLFGMFSLYLFTPSFGGGPLYVSAYSDFLIGVAFAAPLLLHFAVDRESKNTLSLLLEAASLMLLPLIKDIGLALALIGSVIILFDIVLFKSHPFEKITGRKRLFAKILLPLLVPAAPLISFFLWSAHFSAIHGLSKSTVSYEYSFLEMLMGKDPVFNRVVDRMTELFFSAKLVLFGSVFVMCLAFTLVPILLAALSRDKKKFLRVTVFSVLCLLGYLLYYLFHAYSYAAIFGYNGTVVDFYRYMSTAPIGWMLSATGVCVFSVAPPPGKRLASATPTAVTAAVLIVILLFNDGAVEKSMVFNPDVALNQTITMDLRRAFRRELNSFEGYLTPDDRFYCIAMPPDGTPSVGWENLIFLYEVMPAVTVDLIEGGVFTSPDTPDELLQYYQVRIDKASFIAYLRQKQVNYVYVFSVDTYFTDEFSDLFDDRLMSFYDGTTKVYMVIDKPDGFILAPVSDGQLIDYVKQQYQV